VVCVPALAVEPEEEVTAIDEVEDEVQLLRGLEAVPHGRGLHSFTSHLNVSTFCWIRWVVSVAAT
jgi:hypothetical protein